MIAHMVDKVKEDAERKVLIDLAKRISGEITTLKYLNLVARLRKYRHIFPAISQIERADLNVILKSIKELEDLGL